MEEVEKPDFRSKIAFLKTFRRFCFLRKPFQKSVLLLIKKTVYITRVNYEVRNGPQNEKRRCFGVWVLFRNCRGVATRSCV